MQRITLQFPSMQLLWSFVRILKHLEFEVSYREKSLTGSLEEDYISEALTYYKARIVKEKVKSDIDQTEPKT